MISSNGQAACVNFSSFKVLYPRCDFLFVFRVNSLSKLPLFQPYSVKSVDATPRLLQLAYPIFTFEVWDSGKFFDVV